MGRMVGRYELLRPLGRGGMAEVFLARRRGPGGVEKRLVVKRIRRERAKDPRFLKLFVQEARLSMSLAHKNIVPMFDFGRAGDELFLVMEYVDGVDLGAVFEKAREHSHPIDPVVAAYIVMEACQALDYAHGGDTAVVHRDVTPRNVLLSRSGEVKLVDFGVATTETDVGGAKRVRGTPAYMAPEQARGDDVDGRADVFSLGLVLWEALTGRRAYDANDSQGLLDQARAAKVPPLPDTVPDELRAIVDQATRADVDERFPSARAMQIALDGYVVAARSGDENRTPPALRLLHWLAEILPDRAANDGAAGDELPAPDGPVVTFLEDGLEEVVATLAPGNSTMRSIAETIIDDDAPPGGATAARTELESTDVGERRPARAGVWLLGAAVLIAGGIGVYVAASGNGDSAPPAAAAPDAAPADTAPPDAGAPPPDAAAPPPDAAPAPDATPRRRIRNGKPKKPPPTGPPGTVTISSQPWAQVTVVGRDESCPETPCTLTLPPGTYKLELYNPHANVGKRITVTVESDEKYTVVERLTRRQ